MKEKNIIEREIETGSLTTSYQPLLTAQENKYGSKMMLRNTTADRIVLRFNEDDAQIMTLEPSEKVVFGGIAQFSGKSVEVKTDTSVPASIRLNLIG